MDFSTATDGSSSASREVCLAHPLHLPVFYPLLPLFSLAEFGYDNIFRLWETIWAARLSVSDNFEEFIALGILQQFKLVLPAYVLFWCE